MQPSTAYEVPGRGTYYTNSEGRIHYVETEYGTKGNPNTDLMNPALDTTYVVGDHHVFQTDGSSRTVLAHVDDLFRGDAYRSSSVTGRVGRQGVGYEGGHRLGTAFGGGTEDLNLAAMLREVNRGSGHSFGNLKGDVRRLLDETPKPTMEVNVRPRFSGDGDVPQLIRAEYRINGGEWQRARFRNV